MNKYCFTQAYKVLFMLNYQEIKSMHIKESSNLTLVSRVLKTTIRLKEELISDVIFNSYKKTSLKLWFFDEHTFSAVYAHCALAIKYVIV